jgi:hypothetical protein
MSSFFEEQTSFPSTTNKQQQHRNAAGLDAGSVAGLHAESVGREPGLTVPDASRTGPEPGLKKNHVVALGTSSA